ncbi:MAG TPA: PLD nuclease N-terminal domain-containing protein [Jatrophihabitans sp.]|nr:PLD nuclease N-terminal domain-containing protein [Jatrophihabitans sp.]
MLYFDGLFGLVMLGLWLYCLFDVITTDASRCRNLPKLLWVFIVLLLPDIGSVAWLVAGHPWQDPSPRTGPVGRYPEYDRPGRQVASNPDDDEEFLRGLRERTEQQRRDYQARREQQLRAEQERQQRPDQPGRDG